MFTDQDVRGTTKVCIIGKTVVTQLFPNEDPVGQSPAHSQHSLQGSWVCCLPKGCRSWARIRMTS